MSQGPKSESAKADSSLRGEVLLSGFIKNALLAKTQVVVRSCYFVYVKCAFIFQAFCDFDWYYWYYILYFKFWLHHLVISTVIKRVIGWNGAIINYTVEYPATSNIQY